MVKEEKKFIANGRILVEEERRKKVENYHKEKQALEKELNRQLEINRAEDYKKLALEYKEKNLEKRIRKQKVHREICSEIMGFILDLTDVFQYIIFEL